MKKILSLIVLAGCASADLTPMPEAASPFAPVKEEAMVESETELAMREAIEGLDNAAITETPKQEPEPAPVEEPKQTSSDIKDKMSISGPSWYEGIEIGAGLGVPTGLNIRLGYRHPYSNSFWKNRFGYRLDYNTIDPVWNRFEARVNERIQDEVEKEVNGRDDLVEGIIFDNASARADVKGRQIGALIDFRPFGYTWGLGGLRLTGGYYFGNMELRATVDTPDIMVEQNFEAELELAGGGNATVMAHVAGDIVGIDSVKAGIRLNARGPYLGVGWDIGLIPFMRDTLHLTIDAGVVFSKQHVVFASIPEFGASNINNTDIRISATADEAAFEDLFNDMYARYCAPGQQFNGNPFCNQFASFNPNITIDINQDVVDQFLLDYTEFIGELNDEVQYEVRNAVSDANDELRDYPYFPMVKVGLMWRF
ncbi:MAG: hypothetical protein FWD15_01990 [Alphaproteobacteria bacterium]|nr:hypothetical protein [Alphaproteobacteria bacterium]